MSLILIGLNHKTAPISVREKLAQLCGKEIPGVDGSMLEAVPVFTCNRAEIYFNGQTRAAKTAFKKYLEKGSLHFDDLENFFYERNGVDVIKHLFEVASGLDSMIIGENQILHQVKESYQHSTSEGLVGKQLHSLFQKALEVGKKVRSETGISENRVSIASTAVELAKSIFGPLNSSNAVIVGAGEMAQLVATHLTEHKIKNMAFVNRTIETATRMAEQFNAIACGFEKLEEQIRQSDIIITSTSAPHQIIRKELMEKIMPQRAERPVFIIDIAVPRDVEPECQNIENLYLYDVDDLQNVVNENIQQRKTEAEKARTIVNYEASQFELTIQSFTVVPLIRALREQAEKIRKAEVETFFGQNPDLSDDLKKSIELHSCNLMKKWLHNQIIALKNQGAADKNKLKLYAEALGLPYDCLPSSPLRSLSKEQRETA
jgi:glutamyl-tRNA reductase